MLDLCFDVVIYIFVRFCYNNPQLNPVKRTKEEAVILAKKLRIEIFHARLDTKVHYLDGTYYFFKIFNHLYPVLNELIGPKIARYLELRSAQNYPAIMQYHRNNKFYGIVSKNFKDPNKEYKNIFQLGFNNKTSPHYRNIRKLKKYCRKEDYEEILNDIFKMTALDYLMGQKDRVASNFLFEQDGDKITLAPLFDYAESYDHIKWGCYFNQEKVKRSCSVGNALFAPAFWDPKFKKFLKKYPRFQKYLEKIQEIDIIEILKEIEDEHKLIIPEDYKKYYDVRTKEKQKSLVL